MAIEFQHTIDVPQSSQAVFGLLDDLSQTPKWLERCTNIERLTPGDNAVGSKLRYSYREPGRTGVMDGEITARTQGEHLSFRYWDRMMDVTVDFRVASAGAGTKLTHTIAITPKTLMGKLMSPLIRRALPKQTTDAMEKLRGMLAAS